MKKYIYSLSHIDLDGYFCQYLLELKFKQNSDSTIEFFNCNYGSDIIRNLKKIAKKAKKQDNHIIYITDLSLTDIEADFIDDLYHSGLNLIVFDHHLTDIPVEQYEWLHIDTSKSAAAIVSEKINQDSGLLESVNNYDMWNTNEDIYVGSLITEIINQDLLFSNGAERARFFLDFFYFFDKVLIDKSLSDINVHDVFSQFWKQKFKNQESLSWALAREYVSKNKFEKVSGKYVVFYEIGRIYFQYISSITHEENMNVVLVNVSKNGRVSCRSKSVNVGEICKSSLPSGGGHEYSAGGYLGVKIIESLSEAKEVIKEMFPA